MSISFVFAFAPIPLTEEQSPLLHAAIIVRRHQEHLTEVSEPRYRIKPVPVKNEGSHLEKRVIPDELKTATEADGKTTQL